MASLGKLCLGKLQMMEIVTESISLHSLNVSIIIFRSPTDALQTEIGKYVLILFFKL